MTNSCADPLEPQSVMPSGDCPPGGTGVVPGIAPARALPVLAPLLLIGAGFWTWLAFAVHTSPVPGGEAAGYVDRAHDLLDWTVPGNASQPLGMPALIAAVAVFGVEAFVAGRLVAIASGLVLVACTFLLARTFASRTAALVAAIAVGASQYVMLGSVQASADVPAAALLAVALFCWTRAAAGTGTTSGVLTAGGFAFGLAAFVRLPALGFLPAIVPVLAGVSWRERARRIGWSALGFCFGFGPQPVLASFALARSEGAAQPSLQADGAELLLDSMQPDRPQQWADVPAWLASGFSELVAMLGRGIGSSFGVAPTGPAPVVAAVALAVAMTLPLVLRRRRASVLALGAWSCAIATCLFAAPVERLTVPLAMPVVLLLVHAFAPSPTPLVSRWRSVAAVAAAAACATATLLAAPRALADFARLHAGEEVPTIRQLVVENGEWISLATPHWSVWPPPCTVIPFTLAPGQATSPAAAWQELLGDDKVRQADFVMISRRDLPRQHAALLAAQPPAGHEVLQRDNVLLIARTDVGREWFEFAEVVVHDDECRLRIRLAPGVDRQKLLGVGFLFRDGPGEWQRFLLPPGADGSYVSTIPGGRFVGGSSASFVPALVDRDGVVRRGRRTPVQLRGN